MAIVLILSAVSLATDSDSTIEPYFTKDFKSLDQIEVELLESKVELLKHRLEFLKKQNQELIEKGADKEVNATS